MLGDRNFVIGHPVPDMAQGLFGQIFGDRGYVSQKLFEQLYQQGLQLIESLLDFFSQVR